MFTTKTFLYYKCSQNTVILDFVTRGCVKEHVPVFTTDTRSLTWTSQEMDLSCYQLGSQGGSALKSKCSR